MATVQAAVRGRVVDPVARDCLHDHLVRDHHRLPHELTGLPLDAVHELEHFDGSVGLLDLGHTHGAGGR